MRPTPLPMWEHLPLAHVSKIPTITPYLPDEKKSDAAVIICPGGGYSECCDYEGHNYALALNRLGVTAFVLDYRHQPDRYPMPVLDARRAVRFVRHHAGEYGISPEKVLIMGSSAGGHLAALTATFREPIAGEGADAIDTLDFTPNGQILCYPVIEMEDPALRHEGSAWNLLQGNLPMLAHTMTPSNIADKKTPPAFIVATMTDQLVPVENSIRYAEKLHAVGVDCELHLFPYGPHGIGLADGSAACPADAHLAEWVDLLAGWLRHYGFLA